MNKLSREDRARILHLLCEGNSIRAVTRLTSASKKAVSRLLVDAGQAAFWYQDRVFRNLTCKRIQVDEIWAFVHCKQKNVANAKRQDLAYGDVWTWTAIDADTKLIPSWLVGGRDSEYAMAFMDDLASRLASRVQLTSDGHRAYLEAVEGAFGGDIDYAMLIKLYGPTSESAKGRYSPAECIGSRKMRIEGDPDIDHVSTSYAERSNLTVRMHTRRFTRLTNGFSKKVENHAHSVALFAMYYNFVRVHKTLRVTPAMAANVTKRLWEMSDIVDVLEAWDWCGNSPTPRQCPAQTKQAPAPLRRWPIQRRSGPTRFSGNVAGSTGGRIMSIQQHPEYHEGFFDCVDGEALFVENCSAEYKAGWLAAGVCRAYFERPWDNVPAEIQKRFPEHYARVTH